MLVNLGALCSVGPTPIHPELGCEKAEGTEELYGSPSGISVLVPGYLYIKKSALLKNII